MSVYYKVSAAIEAGNRDCVHCLYGFGETMCFYESHGDTAAVSVLEAEP